MQSNKRLLLSAWLVGVFVLNSFITQTAVQAQIPATAGWQIYYLYYDESVETNQGYQLSSLKTTDTSIDASPVFRFPPDGVAPIWDEPPPAIISPDGQSLAMIQWGVKLDSLILISLSKGTVTPLPGITITGLLDTTPIGWLPDGQTLMLYNSGEKGGQVIAYDLAHKTSKTLFTLADVLTFDSQVTLSPDGKQIVYCVTQTDSGCGGYVLQSLDSSPERKLTFPTDTGCPGYPAIKWSPDSHKIGLGCSSLSQTNAPSIVVIDAQQATVTQYPVSSEINDLVWNPDATKVLIDLCAGQDVVISDKDCGPLQYMDVSSGALTAGPVVDRLAARRLFWLGDTLLVSEASSDTQSAALSFYNIQTGKLIKQLGHNTAIYQDASFTIMGVKSLP